MANGSQEKADRSVVESAEDKNIISFLKFIEDVRASCGDVTSGEEETKNICSDQDVGMPTFPSNFFSLLPGGFSRLFPSKRNSKLIDRIDKLIDELGYDRRQVETLNEQINALATEANELMLSSELQDPRYRLIILERATIIADMESRIPLLLPRLLEEGFTLTELGGV